MHENKSYKINNNRKKNVVKKGKLTTLVTILPEDSFSSENSTDVKYPEMLKAGPRRNAKNPGSICGPLRFVRCYTGKKRFMTEIYKTLHYGRS